MIIPVEDRLLIEEEVKESVLAMPEGSAREQMRIGVVIDAGDKVTIPNVIGKRVLFERYGPKHLKDFGERLFLAKQQYVVAIVNEDK